MGAILSPAPIAGLPEWSRATGRAGHPGPATGRRRPGRGSELARGPPQRGLAYRRPGTRLGLWTHFTTQFSGLVFTLLVGVLAGTGIGPVLGQLTAAFPMRRSNLVFGVLAVTVATWTVVLLWPGPAPLPVVVLVLAMAAYGPASAVGFDFARTFDPTSRLGAATGIVNMGGFVAALVTIFAIGVILDARAPGGAYGLADFKVAFAFQYVVWAFGLVVLWRSRRQARAELREEGTVIDPLAHAIARRWRGRRGR